MSKTEAGFALNEVEVSLSAVKDVSRTIISHNTRIALKTSPMPRAVIHKEVESSFIVIIQVIVMSVVCDEAILRREEIASPQNGSQ